MNTFQLHALNTAADGGLAVSIRRATTVNGQDGPACVRDKQRQLVGKLRSCTTPQAFRKCAVASAETRHLRVGRADHDMPALADHVATILGWPFGACCDSQMTTPP
jgi:hypothetical protein